MIQIALYCSTGKYPIYNPPEIKLKGPLTDGAIGKAISRVSRGPYVHASTILDDKCVIEAQAFKGVQKLKSVTEGQKKGRVIDIYDVDLTPEQEKIITEFLHAQIGKKYDWMMIFGFVLYASREGRKSRNKWFCSELVFASFEKANCILLERVDPWKVNPFNLSWSSKLKFNRRIIV